MGDAPQRQSLNTVIALWGALVPALTTLCAVFIGPVTHRIQVFQPRFPQWVTLAIYTPNEYVRMLCLVGPVGIALVSAIFGLIILGCRWKPSRYTLFVASVAFVLNMLFIASVLSAFVLELLRAFPFQNAAAA